MCHPSVLQTLANIRATNTRLGMPTTVCGEMAADPIGVVLLIGLGYRSLSMNAYSLPRVREQVRTLSVETACRLTRRALQQASAADVRAVIAERVQIREMSTSN